MRIRCSIHKNKVTKEPLVEEEYQNNENETNNQNKYVNYMDSALVKDNEKTQHSETTEDIKKSPEESQPQYNFQGNYSRSEHWFDIDPDYINDNFITREPNF